MSTSTISGTFFRVDSDGDSVATNDATATLFTAANYLANKGGSDPTLPIAGTAVPSAGETATATTGTTHGGVGSYRFASLSAGVYYVGLEYGDDDPVWDTWDVGAAAASTTYRNVANFSDDVQSAIDDCPTDGGEVLIPTLSDNSDYDIDTALTVPSGVRLTGSPGVVLCSQMSGGGNSYTDNIISIIGDGATATTTGVATGNPLFVDVITVDDSAGFSEGDWCLLSESATQKELLRIEDITGNDITFERTPHFVYTGSATLTVYDVVEDVIIEGIKFTADTANDCGIYLKNAINVTIRDCIFEGIGNPGTDGYSIRATFCDNITVENCTFYGQTSSASNAIKGHVWFGGDSTDTLRGFVHNSTIENCVFAGLSQFPVWLAACSGTAIVNNQVNKAKYGGINLYGYCNNSIVNDNIIVGAGASTGGNGILVQSSDYVSISGNTSNYCGGSGIYVVGTAVDSAAGVSGAGITGNTCYYNSVAGINLYEDVSGCSISSNSVYYNRKAGILLKHNCSNNAITANSVIGNNSADQAPATATAYGGIGFSHESAGCDYNVISGNTINVNFKNNVGIYSGDYNVISGNTVYGDIDNTDYGIYLVGSGDPTYNVVSNNVSTHHLVADFYVPTGDNHAVLEPGATSNGTNVSYFHNDFRFLDSGSGLAFGSCHGYEIGWSQVAVQNTWYEVSDADIVDGGLNGISHDGSGLLTVTDAGKYLLTGQVTMANTASKHVVLGWTKNNGASAETYPKGHAEANAGEEISVSINGIVTLAADDEVELSVMSTDAGTTIGVEDYNLTLIQVGG